MSFLRCWSRTNWTRGRSFHGALPAAAVQNFNGFAFARFTKADGFANDAGD
jgi:hypothetical protein